MFTDPILNALIKKYPAPEFEDRSDFLYQSLIREIIGQQLHTKVAHVIFNRFLNLFQQGQFPTPNNILTCDTEILRIAGMSYAKVSYLKSTAEAFAKNQIDVKKIKQMSDEEVIKELTKIKGVGKWTAEMILIFTLNRPDVFSLGDLGLRNAITRLYGITDKKDMERLATTWVPNRSTACWYLWRSLENS